MFKMFWRSRTRKTKSQKKKKKVKVDIGVGVRVWKRKKEKKKRINEKKKKLKKKRKNNIKNKCAFHIDESYQLILLFSLFLLLFMNFITLFGNISGSYCTILDNFYLYLQYFQQENFCFSKISGSQTDPKKSKLRNVTTIFSQ